MRRTRPRRWRSSATSPAPTAAPICAGSASPYRSRWAPLPLVRPFVHDSGLDAPANPVIRTSGRAARPGSAWRAQSRRSLGRLAEDGLPDDRVIAPDLRGHGPSYWEPPWDVATHL